MCKFTIFDDIIIIDDVNNVYVCVALKNGTSYVPSLMPYGIFSPPPPQPGLANCFVTLVGRWSS